VELHRSAIRNTKCGAEILVATVAWHVIDKVLREIRIMIVKNTSDVIGEMQRLG
jgi:hypothetical protein